MLTVDELEALLVDLESDRVERKASLSDSGKVRQVICAFANDLPDHQQPGIVFIGLNDDGTCAHLPITDELLRAIAAMRDDGNIQPFPIMAVNRIHLNGCDVAVIEVQPAYNPPVRYNGRAWIRVGPRRATASIDEERRLTEKRRAGNLSFDQQPVVDATLDDLDLNLFRTEYLPAAVSPDVLDENQRSIEQQLASLRFLSRSGAPNNAAMLVFGIEPLRWLPGAYVQLVRFDGTELSDPIRHQKEMSGPLSQLIRQLDEVLDANISVATDVTGGATEVRQPDFPIVALQQLTRNVVMHRVYEGTNAPSRVYWFSDRIEIYSPGGPYGQVNAGNFGQTGATDYRNPLLAEAMKTLGYVQRFGIGIALAQRQAELNGNPPIEFQVMETAILAIVRRRL